MELFGKVENIVGKAYKCWLPTILNSSRLEAYADKKSKISTNGLKFSGNK